jgi:hypothetical protein
MNYLLTLTHERYSVLASWPDFTKAVRARALAAAPLKEALHASFVATSAARAESYDAGYAEALVRPHVSVQYGKDYYYRAHPEDLRRFYALVDDFHRMWDVTTEFSSLSGLASQLLPGERRSNSSVLALLHRA